MDESDAFRKWLDAYPASDWLIAQSHQEAFGLGAWAAWRHLRAALAAAERGGVMDEFDQWWRQRYGPPITWMDDDARGNAAAAWDHQQRIIDDLRAALAAATERVRFLESELNLCTQFDRLAVRDRDRFREERDAAIARADALAARLEEKG